MPAPRVSSRPCSRTVAPRRARSAPGALPSPSVSKTPRAALRNGGVLTPPLMLAALRGIKRDDDFGGHSIALHVLAYLLKSDLHDRHLRGLRRRYRPRREAFLEAIGRRLPDWQVMGSAGGLHLLVTLPPGVPAQAGCGRAGRGLSVLGLEAMSGKTRGARASLSPTHVATQDIVRRRRRDTGYGCAAARSGDPRDGGDRGPRVDPVARHRRRLEPPRVTPGGTPPHGHPAPGVCRTASRPGTRRQPRAVEDPWPDHVESPQCYRALR